MAVLLDNIRSAWNVGSILRSADGFGFSHAYLCGITPTGDNEAVTKTSLGAEDSVPWSHHKDAVKLAKGLKTEGWRIYVLEEDVRGVEIGLAGTAASRRYPRRFPRRSTSPCSCSRSIRSLRTANTARANA